MLRVAEPDSLIRKVWFDELVLCAPMSSSLCVDEYMGMPSACFVLKRALQALSAVRCLPPHRPHFGTHSWFSPGLEIPHPRQILFEGSGHTSILWPTLPHA